MCLTWLAKGRICAGMRKSIARRGSRTATCCGSKVTKRVSILQPALSTQKLRRNAGSCWQNKHKRRSPRLRVDTSAIFSRIERTQSGSKTALNMARESTRERALLEASAPPALPSADPPDAPLPAFAVEDLEPGNVWLWFPCASVWGGRVAWLLTVCSYTEKTRRRR